jgi:hypothetical protein
MVEVAQKGQVVLRSTFMHPVVGAAEIRQPGCSDPAQALWIRSTSSGTLGDSETAVFLVDLGSQDGSTNAPHAPFFRPYAVCLNGAFVKADPADELPSIWRVVDLSYSYWLTSGARRPLPTLDGSPGPDGLAWHDPKPSDGPDAARLASARARIRELASSANPTPASESDAAAAVDEALGLALSAFLELAYAGRAPEAWSFLADVFDDGLGVLIASPSVADVPRSREALERALLEQMLQSPFADELRRRNRGSIAPMPNE